MRADTCVRPLEARRLAIPRTSRGRSHSQAAAWVPRAQLDLLGKPVRALCRTRAGPRGRGSGGPRVPPARQQPALRLTGRKEETAKRLKILCWTEHWNRRFTKDDIQGATSRVEGHSTPPLARAPRATATTVRGPHRHVAAGTGTENARSWRGHADASSPSPASAPAASCAHVSHHSREAGATGVHHGDTHSALRRDSLTPATPWRNLEDVTRRYGNQTQKDRVTRLPRGPDSWTVAGGAGGEQASLLLGTASVWEDRKFTAANVPRAAELRS